MTSDLISATHAFTTRLSGVSSGIYFSLNLGTNRGDDGNNVRQNYSLLGRAVGFDEGRLVFSHQIHENTVRRVTSADIRPDLFDAVPYDADGLVTNEKNLPIIIFTADCIPILMHDPATGAIGAVHAGWRGTVLDISGEGVRAMVREFGSDPKNIRVAIGPGIGRCCFETGPDVPAAVRTLEGIDADEYIDLSGDKAMVDLKGVNRALLIKSGIKAGNIDVSNECTKCLNQKYWSHRHTMGNRGSQASIIML